MKINRIILVFVSFLIFSCQNSVDSDKDELLKIQTDFGEMIVVLHDETPIHKKKFLKLVKNKAYQNALFQQIIADYGILGGKATNTDFEETKNEIESEIHQKFYPIKGALVAHRNPDPINPKRKTSASQFFIIQGKKLKIDEITNYQNQKNIEVLSPTFRAIVDRKENPNFNRIYDSLKQHPKKLNQEILNLENQLQKIAGSLPTIHYSEKQQTDYQNIGGLPSLENQHTIFGQVIAGLPVIDSLSQQATTSFSIPRNKQKFTITTLVMSREEISNKYGYTYP